ncbi:manganese-dependent ADP-ribose/CDP-alcohol diphosphatase isoform 2-T2 [Mantella aurantiaca]
MAKSSQETSDFLQDEQPYFSFGVIADIQYSTKPNGPSSWRVMRYFQQSLLHLQQAIEQWSREDPLPKFILQLGDIIDCSNHRMGRSKEALETVLKDVEQANIPFHHIWGNHELCNFKRDFLRQSKLNTSWMQDKHQEDHTGSHDEINDHPDYYVYHFSPHSKFCIIIVDTYDLSVHGREVDSQRYQDSLDFLEKLEEEIHTSSTSHLAEFNGGLSCKQLSWLDKALTHCDQQNKKVIIAGHTPIHPEAKRTPCLAWNYKDILRVIHSHQSVVCYFAGHDHSGGYHQDSHGIHHVTMEGVIESPPDTNALGTVDVYEDRMVLRGRGRVKSRVLYYRKICSTCFCLPRFALEKNTNLK